MSERVTLDRGQALVLLGTGPPGPSHASPGEADAIAREGIGLMHNDQRTAFVRQYAPSTAAE